MRSTPVVGWLASMNRTVYVKREHRMGVAQQINALKEALAATWAVTVFPEGTTTDGHSLLPFKPSMLSVLEPPPPGVMVQPVMLDYGEVAEWIGWIGEEGGLNNAKRVLARKGTFDLHLHFLEPFSPAEYVGRKQIGKEARRRIEEALLETLGKPLRPFAQDVPPVRYSAHGDEQAQTTLAIDTAKQEDAALSVRIDRTKRSGSRTPIKGRHAPTNHGTNSPGAFPARSACTQTNRNRGFGPRRRAN